MSIAEIPPVVSAAAAALPPVNWPLELLKLFVPPILTLIGVYIAFKLANRGRKYEILYKERYRATEEVIGHLYSVSGAVINMKNRAFELSVFQNDEKILASGEASAKLLTLVDEFNPKYLVVLKPEDRDSYFDLMRRHFTLHTMIIQFKHDRRQLAEIPDIEEQEQITAMMGKVDAVFFQYNVDSLELISKLYNSLELPQR
ncbi:MULTISPECIES: hypothetical protein [Deinococcus]|uniref:Uncharacterized protein n=1 Tax=Deinococcus rufus TaxID=2136097 RepID=A0ABV7Z7S7_9DEIO|nr:hypothetical protein [Deinococcus sp. AB2017081]WQE94409.1 hypothetical protein U2P90_13470 [Deinococcus sp. AB2017081]